MVRSVLTIVLLLVCLAGTSYADKSTQGNVDRCKKFFAEISKGNLKIVDELVDDKFVDHEEFPGMKPGKEGLHDFFQMMHAAFDGFQMKPEFFVADGDLVTCYLTMSGTQKGEFMGMPSAGKKFSIHGIDIVRIKDGKAVEHWGVTDAMAMMEQLGAMENH